MTTKLAFEGFRIQGILLSLANLVWSHFKSPKGQNLDFLNVFFVLLFYLRKLTIIKVSRLEKFEKIKIYQFSEFSEGQKISTK